MYKRIQKLKSFAYGPQRVNPLVPRIRISGEIFQFLVGSVLVTNLCYMEKQKFLSYQEELQIMFSKN